MTVEDWLRSREPAAPPALQRRIEEALHAYRHDDVVVAPGRCMDAAEQLLVELCAHPHAGRESALDLLTVDALVTYAFEAGSGETPLLEQRARQAMLDVARLGKAAC